MKERIKEHIDDKMIKLEVNLDDMNPEFYGYILDNLFELGVNDAYIEQVVMKKNRPGQVLNVLCAEQIKDSIIAFLFAETTTLGIRYTPYVVHRLEREFLQVNTDWGEATVKIGYHQGIIVQIAPEYDECIGFAKRYGIPLKLVYDMIKGKGYEEVKKLEKKSENSDGDSSPPE